MTEAQKQNLKKNVQDAIRHLAEARESLEDAADILHAEIEQLFIGRLLTHKKGESQEMFEVEEDKSRLRYLAERLNTYMDNLITITDKYE